MIKLSVFAVDGETVTSIETAHPRAALMFLKENDHEGSTLRLVVEQHGAEAVYSTLRKMTHEVATNK